MQEKMIELKQVSKSYYHKSILNNINLSIHKGQSLAFIGYNGTGKSTLLKIIAKLVRVTSGEVQHCYPLLFHYIPENFPQMNMSAKQYLFRMGRLDGLETTYIQTKCEQLFENFFMQEMSNTPLKHLSKGTLQKVGIIQSLIKTPDILILDEPLSGQDMKSQKVFIEMMNQLRQQNVTLLMSCHEKNLINSISDTVFNIENGSLEQLMLQGNIYGEQEILLFEHNNQIEKPLKLEYPIEKVGDLLKITVPKSKSNEFIVSMIQKGWRLRGMYHENNV